MKKIFVIAFLILSNFSFCQNQADLLSGKYSKEELTKILIPVKDWKPFADITNTELTDREMFEAFVKSAEKYIDYEWPYIPATKSLLIERTGDRDEYQNISFQKRRVLGTMVLAEVYENKGRFIDPIINGIWSICEESWWGVPAHLPRGKEYGGLMDVSEPFVDLFAAETATYLSWAYYFLGDQLDAVSPQIRKRIYYETNRRIFEPLMNKHHGWMGYSTDGSRPNNWNPWICSNWLNSVLLLEQDEIKRVNHVYKILDVLDEFLNPYPQDGGCDEGPGYWGAAAASLFDNLALLNLATNNSFSYIFSDLKIKNMAQFIYKAQISEKYFLNFADADPQPEMDAEMIYRFGKAIDDTDMKKFGAFYHKDFSGEIYSFHFFRNIFSLYLQDEIKSSEKGLPLPESVWYPDLQVMMARDKKGSTDGFFVAAKGGNNNESHNHNDIGNYVVYYDGLPLLIDVGRGTYTLKTFSDQRYTIWFNCSDYHNIPSINGFTQQPGAEYKSKNVTYKNAEKSATFSLDLSEAYPKVAGVTKWKRTLNFNRGKNIVITDEFDLTKIESITQHFMTCYPCEANKSEVIIHYPDQNFKIGFNKNLFNAEVEKVKLESMEDQGIIQKWGDNIYRINLIMTNPTKKGIVKIEIKESD
ncbi:MAG: heparinase II/III family protein [Prolixibacteraceae bacterium]|nr:heparinase II/III family protein [Prolixibacteraceae bacterium]MBN2775284.1 heparinase II/III family protein [Prolixibacteraceae bacterium]